MPQSSGIAPTCQSPILRASVHLLMVQILYGSGLRLMECVRPCVKDIDFAHQQIVVRDGKGATVQELLGHKDASTTMIYTQVPQKGPLAVRSPLDM